MFAHASRRAGRQGVCSASGGDRGLGALPGRCRAGGDGSSGAPWGREWDHGAAAGGPDDGRPGAAALGGSGTGAGVVRHLGRHCRGGCRHPSCGPRPAGPLRSRGHGRQHGAHRDRTPPPGHSRAPAEGEQRGGPGLVGSVRVRGRARTRPRRSPAHCRRHRRPGTARTSPCPHHPSSRGLPRGPGRTLRRPHGSAHRANDATARDVVACLDRMGPAAHPAPGRTRTAPPQRTTLERCSRPRP